MTESAQYDDPFERYSYASPLIEKLRARDGRMTAGRVTVRAASSFGFCWGVDRAVAMVHDAINGFPDRRIWLLDQIIHNPRVNADFKARGVHFVRGPFADPTVEALDSNDVVVIPAFSATVEDTRRLQDVGCTIVDTTCPWVIKPHKRTLKYVRDGFTTVVHGLVQHEETRASASLIASEGGHFVVVVDREQAQWVCDVIRGELDGEVLRQRLPEGALSEGFDSKVHLVQVGTINQTTMLASETREIERMLRGAMQDHYGEQDVDQHFRELNTICRATQDNQDAVGVLVADADLDLMIVVGGYDSSNTRNLTRVGGGHFPSYHVDGPMAIQPDVIRHRSFETGEFIDTAGWLPDGEVTVGFTAGASTPDTLLGETITRVLEVAGAPIDVAATP
jgi:4-hydroxy-3-methylbut-2-enyl diphosphate reductase